MRKLAKRIVLFSLGVLIALVASTITWLTESETAAVWLAAKFVAASQGELAIEGVSGSLFGGLRMTVVRYEDGDMRISAREVVLHPSLSALASLRVEVAMLSMRRLEIAPKPTPGAIQPPDTLALPVDFAIDRAAIDQLIWVTDHERVVARELSFGYRGSATGQALRELHAKTELGEIRGDMTLAASRPYTMKGALSLILKDAQLPGTLHAALGGSLEQLEVALDGTAAGAKFVGTAHIAPFAPIWLTEATLRATEIDLARVDGSLPPTQLAFEARGASRADATIAGALSVRNARPGPLTDRRLPLAALDSPFILKGDALLLSSLRAELGDAGTATGSATIAASRGTIDLAVRHLDLRAIHRPMRATRLDGTIAAHFDASSQSVRAQLTQDGMRFSLDGKRQGNAFSLQEFVAQVGASRLVATGTVALSGSQRFDARAMLERFDPATFGDFPSAHVNATIAAKGELAPAWRADVRFELGTSRWRSAPLSGHGRFVAAADAIRDAEVMLRVGANVVDARGALGHTSDTLAVSLTAPQLAEIDPHLAGQMTLSGTVRGAFTRPAIDAELTGKRLQFFDRYRAATLDARAVISADDDPRIDLDLTGTAVGTPRFAFDSLNAKANGNLGRHVIELHAVGKEIDLASRLSGRWRAGSWTGTVDSLANRGRFRVELTSPMAVELARERIVIGETTATLGDGRLTLRGLRWEHARLISQGDFAGVALAPFLTFVDLPTPLSSTLVLRGAWAIDATPRLNGTIALARESGDLVVGASPSVPLELERLNLDARVVDDTITGTLTGSSRRVGTASARLDVGSLAGAPPGMISPDAPLKLAAQLDIASLRPLVALLGGGGAVVDGRVAATMTGAGTLGDARITGHIAASALALDVPEYGLRLANGKLAATLDADALRLDEFSIQGGEGTLTAKGVASRVGTTTIAWNADNLRLFGLPDLRVTVDGSGTVALAESEVALAGTISVRDGRIEFANRRDERLGDDVEVLDRPRSSSPKRRGKAPLKLALDIDLGKRFHIVGAGLDTNLTGRARIATRDTGDLVGKGTIDAVHGIYFFLGQRLEIERGRLIFDGPIENPALDVRAVRKGLPVEPGVELTGTLRTPHVTLTSTPPMSDGDTLSWLVLGRGFDTASAGDAVLIQTAAASLLDNSQSIPIGRRVAQAMGLDDISVKSSGQSQGQALAVGKRLSDRVYLTFERALAATQAAVGLEYLLGRGFRIRATGGQDSNVGVFFTRSWD